MIRHRETHAMVEESKVDAILVGLATSVGQSMSSESNKIPFQIASSGLLMSDIHTVAMNIQEATRAEIHAESAYPTIETPISDQEHTGSCWIQSGMSLFASVYKKQFNTDITFSCYYIHLFDKYMKAKVFLDMMCKEKTEETVWEPYYDWHTLQNPLQDGGTFQMLIFLVNTFGLMPDCCFKKTHAQTHTSSVNEVLNNYLRSVVGGLKGMVETPDVYKQRETEILECVLGALYRFYGIPTRSFVIPLGDTETIAVGDTGQVSSANPPAQKGKGDSLELLSVAECDTLSLRGRISERLNNYDFTVMSDADCRNNPGERRNDTVYVSYFYNNPDDPLQNAFLMKSIAELKLYAKMQLAQGIPVWCSLDVHHDFSSKKGIARCNLFCTDELLKLTTMDKDNKHQRIKNRNTAPVHAMLITKVFLKNEDTIVKWKLQNSWGTKENSDGFVIVDDAWFTQHVFQIAVLTSLITTVDADAMSKAKTKDWVRLPPDDLFSTVASSRSEQG